MSAETTYKIDNVVVPNLQNVRSHFLPGQPQAVVEKQFPGIGERFAVIGPQLPPDLEITALMFATGATPELAYQALVEQMRVQNDRRSTGLTYDVTMHGEIFEDMMLAAFNSAGQLVVFKPDDGTAKVGVNVRWQWRQMSGVSR